MVTHDIDTLMTYLTTNWRSSGGIIVPDKIFRMGSIKNTTTTRQKIRWWMFVNSIELIEESTDYSLLDITGRANKEEDTPIIAIIKSKAGEDNAVSMQKELEYQIHQFAPTNTIGDYAYTQMSVSTPAWYSYYAECTVRFMLTRRGKGHAT